MLKGMKCSDPGPISLAFHSPKASLIYPSSYKELWPLTELWPSIVFRGNPIFFWGGGAGGIGTNTGILKNNKIYFFENVYSTCPMPEQVPKTVPSINESVYLSIYLISHAENHTHTHTHLTKNKTINKAIKPIGDG